MKRKAGGAAVRGRGIRGVSARTRRLQRLLVPVHPAAHPRPPPRPRRLRLHLCPALPLLGPQIRTELAFGLDESVGTLALGENGDVSCKKITLLSLLNLYFVTPTSLKSPFRVMSPTCTQPKLRDAFSVVAPIVPEPPGTLDMVNMFKCPTPSWVTYVAHSFCAVVRGVHSLLLIACWAAYMH